MAVGEYAVKSHVLLPSFPFRRRRFNSEGVGSRRRRSDEVILNISNIKCIAMRHHYKRFIISAFESTDCENSNAVKILKIEYGLHAQL